MSSSSASALPTTGLYEPLRPPLQHATSSNRGPYALLAATTFIILTGLVVIVKLYMIFGAIRKFRLDDYTMMAALTFAVGYTIATCEAVQHGLGRAADDLTSKQIELLSQNYYSASILLYISLAFAKSSVTLLIIQLKPQRWIKFVLFGLLSVIGVWGIAAAFTVAFQCGPDRWVLGPTSNDTCIDQYGTQIGIKIVDIVTDLAIVVLPAVMMLYVQVPWDKRLGVILMFGLRLLTPIFTLLTIVRLSKFYDANIAERPFEAVTPSVWTSVGLNVSLITACLPSIKRFLADWAAGVANAGISEPFELQHSSANKSRSGYGQPSGIRSFGRSQSGTKNGSHIEPERDNAPATYSYYARKGREDRGGDDIETESKKGLTDGVIMQTFDYTVEYDEDRYNNGSGSSSGRPKGFSRV